MQFFYSAESQSPVAGPSGKQTKSDEVEVIEDDKNDNDDRNSVEVVTDDNDDSEEKECVDLTFDSDEENKGNQNYKRLRGKLLSVAEKKEFCTVPSSKGCLFTQIYFKTKIYSIHCFFFLLVLLKLFYNRI